ncbi:MAG: hypothetical protein HFH74_09225 [Lachnospiraceae bacterium]|jgi:hypothetical protein|nr:hypothetical protein [Lachnospiraceae bacterium]
MIKAIATIVVGDKVFQPGQVVLGLSSIDKIWMQKAGYIAETVNGRKSLRTKTINTGQKEADGNEL